MVKNKENVVSVQIIAFCFVAMLVFSGCSNKIKVGGTVHFDDGTPLDVGEVYLSNGTFMFSGSIQPDGTFSLGELKDGDGIPPGNYRVWIAGANPLPPTIDEIQAGAVAAPLKIPVKYTDRDQSGLTFEAKPGGPKTIDIVVEKP